MKAETIDTAMTRFLVVTLVVPFLAFSQAPERARALSMLDQALQDKNPDTRKQAVEALGLTSPVEPYLSKLETMIDDKDVEVQLATITSLVDLKSKRTVPLLKKALDSEVPEVSFAAAKALWSLNDPAGRGVLLSVLNGETKTSSGFLTRQKRDAVRMLHTPRTMFLFAVRTGVGFAPVPGLGAGVSSLQGIMSDSNISGRAATALMLSVDRSPEVLAALREALSDQDASVRAAAVHAIAVRSDPSLKKELLPLMDDKKEAVRLRAAAGFLRLEGMRSVPAKKPAASPKA